MNKLFTFLFTIMFLIIGCSGDDPITGGVDPEPELVGCEAATTYDWDSIEFETSLDGGADTWLAFSLEEITYFTVYVSQAGFVVSVFEGCEGEFGAGDTLFQFETIGNGTDIGIVAPGEYWVNILNTSLTRLEFIFRLGFSVIFFGFVDDDALNYDETANIDDGNCEYNDCNTEWYSANYGDMVLDCDGNCAPVSWIGDGYCDDGAWAIYPSEEAYNNYVDCQDSGGDDCGQYVTPINLWCEELNFDEGDSAVIDEGCSVGLIEDCNGICAPANWLGDGFCDDGSYSYNGNDIYFNCDEFNNDNGDCDGMGRTERRIFNRIPIGQ